MHKTGVDGDQAQDHFKEESHVQRHVRETIREQGLPFCGGRDRSRDLAHDERPIVHCLAFDNRMLLIVGVGARAAFLVHDPEHVRQTEEHDPTKEGLQHADVAIAVDTDPPIGQLDEFRVAGRSCHEFRLGWLEGICDRCPDVGADVNQQDLRDRERLGDAEDHRQGGSELRDLGAERVHNRLPQVRAAQASLLNTVNDAGEVVILQDDVGRVLSDFGAADTHGNADLGLLQGGRIVDTIASHGANVADAFVTILLVGLHDDLLVDRRDTCEDASMGGRLLPPNDVLLGLLIREVVALGHPSVQVDAGDDRELLLVA
mmetsp:Transcript_107762/g.270310  ORF Transcript_107762/g.270310 Transcript_107762/m.270310 type:complete len:317 (+) Transcript_107762:626-1576(+)